MYLESGQSFLGMVPRGSFLGVPRAPLGFEDPGNLADEDHRMIRTGGTHRSGDPGPQT